MRTPAIAPKTTFLIHINDQKVQLISDKIFVLSSKVKVVRSNFVLILLMPNLLHDYTLQVIMNAYLHLKFFE